MDGRTALITGATDGLGRALAADLAGRGARVLVHGRDPGRVSDAAREGGAARAYVAGPPALGGGPRVARGGARGPEGPHPLLHKTRIRAAPAGGRGRGGRG